MRHLQRKNATLDAPAVKRAAPVAVFTKVLDKAEGITEQLVAVTMNLDDGGDVILAGGMDYGVKIAHVWPKGVRGHDWNRPAAKALAATELRPRDPALPGDLLNAGYGAFKITAQYALDTEDGADGFKVVQFFGDEQEWSIGYDAEDVFFAGPDFGPSELWEQTKAALPDVTVAEIEARGVARFLPKVIDYEFSDVLFGMNRLTRTQGTKALEFVREHIDVTDVPEPAAPVEPPAVKTFASIAAAQAWLKTHPGAKVMVDATQRKLWLDADDVLGSDTFEARQAALCDAVSEWATDTFGQHCYAQVVATWADHCVFYVDDYSAMYDDADGNDATQTPAQVAAEGQLLDEDEDGYFSARYTIDGENHVTLDQPVHATVQVTIAPAPPKALRGDAWIDAQCSLAYLERVIDAERPRFKAGRVQAQRNVDRLNEMSDMLGTMSDHVQAMLTEAGTNPEAPDDTSPDQGDAAKTAAAFRRRLELDGQRLVV